MSEPKTLIIIPTYNEQENLENIIRAVHEVVPFVHVLVVDDGSPDGTGAIADRLSEADDRVFVLHRTGKQGLGSAYVAGFKYALARDYQRIMEMDADFSHDPKYLPEMIDTSDHADVVIGSRYVTGGGTENWGLGRRVLSRGGGLYARTVLGMRVQDLTAGFMCYRREALEALDLSSVSSAGYVFQIEMKYRAFLKGMRIREVPIIFPDRVAGTSKMNGSIAREAIVQVWKLKLRVKA